MSAESADIVTRALDRARAAGAEAVDAVLVEDNSLQARVRGSEIDFVSQARERCLGIRALVSGSSDGLSSAVCSTASPTVPAGPGVNARASKSIPAPASPTP